MSGWGCPHENQGTCDKVAGRACEPGMKGCVLRGRFRFADESKNRPRKAPLLADPMPSGESDPDRSEK
jgi:hypothetical protein